MDKSEEIAILKVEISDLREKVEKLEKFIDKNFYSDDGFAESNRIIFKGFENKLDVLQDTIALHLNIPARLFK